MKTRTINLLLLLLFVGSIIYAQPVGVKFYQELSKLPYLYSNAESYYLSSYDRSGGNDDGFVGTYSELYEDENGEHVIFEEQGSGCVYNLWGTGPKRSTEWGKIRFYFDDEKKARLEITSEAFFSGLTSPFLFPLVNHNYISSGGASSNVPFTFAKKLKITTEKKPYFYNIYYQLYKNIKIESWSAKIDFTPMLYIFQSCGTDPKRVIPDSVVRNTGKLESARRGRETPSVELLNIQHGGVIQYIKINPLYTPDTYNLNHIFLKITYDRQITPAVYVPIGPFFGSGLGEADVRGLFIGMSPSGVYYCYLPMPFKTGIKIELENQGYDSGGEFFVDIGYNSGYPDEKKSVPVGYLGAQYKKVWPIVAQEDYELFNFTGKGAVIGQVMTVEPVKQDIKRWWEGDMRITIDNETTPRFHGTGHEDEYQGGWSSFWMSNPYSLPLYGLPKSEGLKNIFGQINGSVTVYRFWPGTIPFRKSIRISTEHGNGNDTPGNYSSLVYYYYLP